MYVYLYIFIYLHIMYVYIYIYIYMICVDSLGCRLVLSTTSFSTRCQTWGEH